jgi:hypothetical protein
VTFLKCHHCGRTGAAIHYWPRYIGGQGVVRRAECDNLHQCWAKWDRDNGFVARNVHA